MPAALGATLGAALALAGALTLWSTSPSGGPPGTPSTASRSSGPVDGSGFSPCGVAVGSGFVGSSRSNGDRQSV
ncbi:MULTISPECIES: hypothetical protein [Pseudofrankia]|uniref:hypothetical protein n=1 Tax=Pseudofrankia TaxID=2994363 RepID=UPI0002F42958|nr:MULTISPECIES: hypothetical protein [Pseudofrankia]